MTLKQGVVIAVALIAFAVLMRIVADVFGISRTEAGGIGLVIVGIVGFAWWHRRDRLEKRWR
jgi:multisubunit Na+/H+ antiporter MnhB subunit